MINSMYRSGLFVILLVSILSSCKSTVQHLATAEQENISVTSVEPNPVVEQFIAQYREDMEAEMGVVIGNNAAALTKARPNSSLGNVVADLLHDQAEIYLDIDVAFAIQNYGGLRAHHLAEGPITRGQIFELMPFDNFLVVLPMKKADIVTLCNMIADANGWPISYGITMKIGGGLASDILIDGVPLEEDRTYQVAMPDYVANGGDGFEFLKAFDQLNTGVFIRDVLTERITQLNADGKMLEANPELRINH